MLISNAAIRNRTTVGVLVFLILVVGTYSYFALPREAAPDVPIPYVLVTTTYEGVSPEDVESSVTMKIEKKLTGLKGLKEIRYAGEKEEQDEAAAFLLRSFLLAVLLIVLVLVAQFNTLLVPVIIMTTVVLSLIGVLGGLLINDMPFGVIMTGIGVISLAGVVVNNAIVLLAYTRQLQREGMDVVSAAVQAGATRLRPVLLTAITTVIGLLPMATGISFDFHTMAWATRSESAEWWRGMAIAVIYGLSFATLLTLFVVPALYVSLYRLADRFGLGGITADDRDSHRAKGTVTNGPKISRSPCKYVNKQRPALSMRRVIDEPYS